MRNRQRVLSLFLHILLGGIVFIAIVPLLWMVSISFRYPQNAFSLSVIGPFTLDNYAKVFAESARFFGNSIIIAASSTAISLFFGVTSGYGISRFNFTGKRYMNVLIMITRMFPPVLLSIGFFEIIVGIRLYDNFLSLIFMNSLFTMPFAIWMMQSYFQAIPVEIDEAGLIDGCSRMKVLFRLIIPVSAPGLVATLVYAFLLSWNEFLFALTFIQSNHKKAATVALSEIMGEWWTHYPQLMAMSVLISIPVMLLFVTVQKHLIAGLASSSVKG